MKSNEFFTLLTLLCESFQYIKNYHPANQLLKSYSVKKATLNYFNRLDMIKK